MKEKNFFLYIRFGLGVYIVDAKNGIFTIFSALAISRNVIFSDISGQTLVSASAKEGTLVFIHSAVIATRYLVMFVVSLRRFELFHDVFHPLHRSFPE